jgi:PIN domain nuclease of toxin-antitoxin system
VSHLLLDTHAFLWWLANDAALGERARAEIARVENPVFVSAASFWEIGIKRAMGQLEAPENLQDVLSEASFLGLPIQTAHAELAGRLPLHHRDPFDRMLVAQAIVEGLQLVTADHQLTAYGIPILDAHS